MSTPVLPPRDLYRPDPPARPQSAPGSRFRPAPPNAHTRPQTAIGHRGRIVAAFPSNNASKVRPKSARLPTRPLTAGG